MRAFQFRKVPKMTGTTLLFVLAAMTIPTVAEAQTSPSTNPTAQAATPKAPAQAPASKPSVGIDRAQCSANLKDDETKLKNKIVEAIRAASKKHRPAIAYEGKTHGVAVQPTAQGIDEAANKQASALASSFMAAVASPKAPANAASDKLFGTANRRASLHYYHRCAGRDGVPVPSIENERIVSSSCGTVTPSIDAGLSASQVFQSSLSPFKVTEAFARSKITSKPDENVRLCFESYEKCQNPANYHVYTPETLKLNQATLNRDIFMVDDVTIMKHPEHMIQYSAMRIVPISVCGSTMYMITAFGNGHTFGFERSSLIGLIGQVGNKTLVVGNLSAQSFKLSAQEKNPWPLWTARKPEGVQDTILGAGAYPVIAAKIGSTERTVMGVLQGSSAPQAPVAPRQNIAGQTAR